MGQSSELTALASSPFHVFLNPLHIFFQFTSLSTFRYAVLHVYYVPIHTGYNTGMQQNGGIGEFLCTGHKFCVLSNFV